MVLKYNGLNILKYESHFEKRRMVVQDSRKGEKINEPKPKNKKISPRTVYIEGFILKFRNTYSIE